MATRSYIEVKVPYGQPYALTPAPDDSLPTTDGIVRYDLRDRKFMVIGMFRAVLFHLTTVQGPLNVAMQWPEGFRHTS